MAMLVCVFVLFTYCIVHAFRYAAIGKREGCPPSIKNASLKRACLELVWACLELVDELMLSVDDAAID